LTKDEYFLAEDENLDEKNNENRLIGFLAVQSVMDEMEICNIAVCPDFQGQGVGSLLLENISDFAGRVFLEVRASNLSAQSLYKKQGFVQYHTRKKYYAHPTEDAILMKREFNG
jgi:ribosomal-protein-alanine N-acetyltransferase